jgi:acetyl-CoA carboxylase carboxyl transferase subunit alpha
MIGGLGQIDGQSFMIVGQQKESILRCVSIEIQDGKSEGYRKALRLMKMAENLAFRFDIDTPELILV